MCYIYCADIYCDDCGDKIKDDMCRDGSAAAMIADGADLTDERSYDSGEYPKGCYGSDESDCPQHCGGCGVFLENDLTTDGADYVIAAVREDLEGGHSDSIACTVWREYYDWIDFPVWGICDDCGEEGFLDNNDVCEGACAWEG
jgi:hypothetical protein